MTRRRPTIIANLTAVGIPGYYDPPNQPHGCVRTEHEELLPASDALARQRPQRWIRWWHRKHTVRRNSSRSLPMKS